jgi:hypothetical protein
MIEYEDFSCISIEREIVVRSYQNFERWSGVRFPTDFVMHSSLFHGGVPIRKCVKTEAGRICVVGRFLNVLRDEQLPQPYIETWRSTERDVRMDYSLWYLNELWPENAWLPFAGVDTDGKDCRECHDYFAVLSFTELGEVVYANGFDEIERIAPDFATFCGLMTIDGNPIASRRVDRY